MVGCNNEAVKKITTDSGEKNVCLNCYRELSNEKMDRMASDISELKSSMNELIDKLDKSKNETEKKGNKNSGFTKYGK